MPRNIIDARAIATAEQARAKQIAAEQEQKAGYRRSAGFDPMPRARAPFVPEAMRPAPLAPSAPLDLSKAGAPKTKRTRFGVNE